MSVDQDSCKHEIVYFGVTNLNYEKRTIGSVDTWRCVKCKKMFCEEKQLGIDSIVDYVGMPKINNDQKWSVLLCNLKRHKDKWKLVKIKKDDEISHECLGEKVVTLKVKDFKIEDDKHWNFLIENSINKAIEI
ncbi:MAG: hypothetical protein KGI33_08435 [Thaumarchaeota archaeon]|nr:hypothetical protein [Nitrososphaerota archaeon]